MEFGKESSELADTQRAVGVGSESTHVRATYLMTFCFSSGLAEKYKEKEASEYFLLLLWQCNTFYGHRHPNVPFWV